MSIELSFFGAAGTVTGSCFLLQGAGARVLVDCGMFQGSKTLKELNYGPFPFSPGALDAVLVTHAHIDHSGLLPKLRRDGYRGPVLATEATAGLLGCMLPDSGHIQETEVEILNRRNRHRGRARVTPIYTKADAQAFLDQLVPVDYGTWREVAPGFRARWWNAGHLLGSSSIEIEVADGDEQLRLLFSGDIGPDHKLLQEPADGPRDLDVIVMEATYGDRDRQDLTAARRRALLADEVAAAQARGGPLLIPSFAVERTQEVVTDLVGLMDAGRVRPAPIYVDSPLAGQATRVFLRFADELADPAALRRAFASRHLIVTESVEQSKALRQIEGFHVIIAASGMCEAGRIRHHLRNWLANERATVLLVGFQAMGTLGRVLQDGASTVRIQGDDVEVRAAIRTLDAYSGHADAPELVAWLGQRGRPSTALFLVHGEDAALAALKARVTEAGLVAAQQVMVPGIDEVFHLARGEAQLAGRAAERIARQDVARLDWHNDLSRLLLDIDAAVRKSADEKGRQVVLRRLRRALDEQAAAGG
ncbi:MBL fold metallo-hydrolase RNA specificity domain-containing protein [Blastochloris tepida]|uniref:MBL fold metallo-hydrolase n=1 Tax=Blastochloris tepida TaxID=2233851 RepID=A0A348FZ51_9HYPH|nr:MBL fold metallo-hydrolase [Blastochloris tepida]BBF92584.1 MBL fold metallo-hydrolase [Blastochloris tepida]